MNRLYGSARFSVPDQADLAEPRRYLFYSHDGVGLGHTARNLAIARALTKEDPTATILLATGTDDALQLGVPERVEILKLPSLRKLSNDHYGARRLLITEQQIHALRSALLTGAVESFRPHVMLVDKHPLGAGGELTMGLAALRDQGGSAVLGLRDILDEPAVVMAEWARHSLAAQIDEAYDQILIYGDAVVFDPIREYHLPVTLAEKACYCGYVVQDRSRRHLLPDENLIRPRPELPCVMATVGGGEDGSNVLAAFLEACIGASWAGIAVTGPQAPTWAKAHLDELANCSGACLLEFVPNLWEAFKPNALVCMGGYNTLCEALANNVPTVCIPRIHPRREQLLRADRFASLGLLEAIHPAVLSVPALRAAIERALFRATRLPGAVKLSLDGARRAAETLSSFAGSTSQFEHALCELAAVPAIEDQPEIICA